MLPWSNIIVISLCVLLITVTYSSVTSFDFSLDDYRIFVYNHDTIPSTPLLSTLHHNIYGHIYDEEPYRPVSVLSLRFSRGISYLLFSKASVNACENDKTNIECSNYFIGLSSSLFHIENIIFHLINSLIVMKLVYFLASRFSSVSRVIFPAGFSACLFAIHPLAIESVALIGNRSILVSTLFSLLTLYFYFRSNFGDLYFNSILSFISIFAAIFSHEQSIILVPLLLMFDLTWSRRSYFRLSFLFIVVIAVTFSPLIEHITALSPNFQHVLALYSLIPRFFSFFSFPYSIDLLENDFLLSGIWIFLFCLVIFICLRYHLISKKILFIAISLLLMPSIWFALGGCSIRFFYSQFFYFPSIGLHIFIGFLFNYLISTIIAARWSHEQQIRAFFVNENPKEKMNANFRRANKYHVWLTVALFGLWILFSCVFVTAVCVTTSRLDSWRNSSSILQEFPHSYKKLDFFKGLDSFHSKRWVDAIKIFKGTEDCDANFWLAQTYASSGLNLTRAIAYAEKGLDCHMTAIFAQNLLNNLRAIETQTDPDDPDAPIHFDSQESFDDGFAKFFELFEAMTSSGENDKAIELLPRAVATCKIHPTFCSETIKCKLESIEAQHALMFLDPDVGLAMLEELALANRCPKFIRDIAFYKVKKYIIPIITEKRHVKNYYWKLLADLTYAFEDWENCYYTSRKVSLIATAQKNCKESIIYLDRIFELENYIDIIENVGEFHFAKAHCMIQSKMDFEVAFFHLKEALDCEDEGIREKAQQLKNTLKDAIGKYLDDNDEKVVRMRKTDPDLAKKMAMLDKLSAFDENMPKYSIRE